MCGKYKLSFFWIFEMFLFIISSNFLTTNFGASAAETDKQLGCRLLWVPVDLSAGTPTSLPSKLIVLDGSDQYVIRGKVSGSSEYVVGRYDPKVSGVYLPSVNAYADDLHGVPIPTSIQLLSNPHECNVEWKDFRGSGGDKINFKVSIEGNPSSGPSGAFVGRRFEDGAKLWYSGHVLMQGGNGEIHIPRSQDDTQKYRDMEVLVSYSDGIEMQVVDFVFEDLFSDTPDFVGMDEIHNPSPAQVTVSVEHKKTVIETYTLTVWERTTSRHTVTVKVLFMKFTFTKTTVTEKSETISTREETNVVVKNEVSVAPFSSIQACTQIQMSSNKRVDYNATAQYIAKGMTGEEVRLLLEEENIPTVVKNGIAQTSVNGSLEVAVAMNTEFVVVPFDARLGCTNAALRSEHVKRQKLLTN